MMQMFLVEDPDTRDAQEFLCLAEEEEVTHYEVLSVIAKEFKEKIIYRNQIDSKERKRSRLVMHIQLANESSSKS